MADELAACSAGKVQADRRAVPGRHLVHRPTSAMSCRMRGMPPFDMRQPAGLHSTCPPPAAGKCNLMQTARRATNRDFKLKAVAQGEVRLASRLCSIALAVCRYIAELVMAALVGSQPQEGPLLNRVHLPGCSEAAPGVGSRECGLCLSWAGTNACRAVQADLLHFTASRCLPPLLL